MSWKNIKTFMIILLLIACIIVGAMLLFGGSKETYTKESLEKAVALMEKSGITIDAEQLTGDFDGMKIYRFNPAKDYPESVAAALTSGNVTDVFTVPGGVEMRTDLGEIIFVGDDFSISYKCPDGSLSESDIKKRLLPTCEAPVFDIRREESGTDSEYVIFTQTLSGSPIPENTVKCKFTNEKLTEFSGKWCFPDKCSTFSAQLRDYLNIMFTERERVDAEDGEKKQLTVKNLEKCYGIENGDGKSVFLLVPSLHVVYKEGESAIHSAVAD